MDKIVALLVTITAVVLVAVVVVFGGISPSIESKADAVMTTVDGLPTSSITP